MNGEVKNIRHRCYELSISIIEFIGKLSIERIYYSLIDQLLRSTTSIGANVIEAKSAHSRRDFIKFYEISLQSANETKYWLCLLRDGLKIEKETLNRLLDETDQISRIIAAIVIKLKRN
jgi:four helix bundle protein